MNEYTLYLTRGLPGGGKSFLSQKIFAKLNIEYCYGDGRNPIILSTDDYWMVGNSYNWESSLTGLAHKWNQRRVSIACDKGWISIVDNTNLTWAEIKPYVAIANNFNYDVHLLNPNTPWAMNVQECFERNQHGVPLETIQRMKDKWQNNVHICQQSNIMFPSVKITAEWI